MDQPPSHNRREFLQGRAAADAIGAAIDRFVPTGTTDEPAKAWANFGQPEHYVVQLSRPAMACTFAIFLNAGQYEQGSEAALAALDRIEELEGQLTVYRDASEVMQINRMATDDDVEVDADLFDLLSLAVKISQATGGAFDITAGPLVKVWGFYKRAGGIPHENELRAALAHVGSRHVKLDATRRTIRFERPGVELNLGAIGKGYALDRAAEVLTAHGVQDVLLHGGQSSVLRADRTPDVATVGPSGWPIPCDPSGGWPKSACAIGHWRPQGQAINSSAARASDTGTFSTHVRDGQPKGSFRRPCWRPRRPRPMRCRPRFTPWALRPRRNIADSIPRSAWSCFIPEGEPARSK